MKALNMPGRTTARKPLRPITALLFAIVALQELAISRPPRATDRRRPTRLGATSWTSGAACPDTPANLCLLPKQRRWRLRQFGTPRHESLGAACQACPGFGPSAESRMALDDHSILKIHSGFL